jgi:hypothetical protein
MSGDETPAGMKDAGSEPDASGLALMFLLRGRGLAKSPSCSPLLPLAPLRLQSTTPSLALRVDGCVAPRVHWVVCSSPPAPASARVIYRYQPYQSSVCAAPYPIVVERVCYTRGETPTPIAMTEKEGPAGLGQSFNIIRVRDDRRQGDVNGPSPFSSLPPNQA